MCAPPATQREASAIKDRVLQERTPETLRSAQGQTARDPTGDMSRGRQVYEMSTLAGAQGLGRLLDGAGLLFGVKTMS